MPFITNATEPVSRYWLWANAGLWSARVVYQLVKPQGSHDPALQWGMLAAFTLPILVVYPFLQRYFVKGAIVGAVKE